MRLGPILHAASLYAVKQFWRVSREESRQWLEWAARHGAVQNCAQWSAMLNENSMPKVGVRPCARRP
jgi:hypothetical protein